jgi:hypothetical protein
MCHQQSTTSRTGKGAIQRAGSAAKGSLDLDLVFLFLSPFPATAAWEGFVIVIAVGLDKLRQLK